MALFVNEATLLPVLMPLAPAATVMTPVPGAVATASSTTSSSVVTATRVIRTSKHADTSAASWGAMWCGVPVEVAQLRERARDRPGADEAARRAADAGGTLALRRLACLTPTDFGGLPPISRKRAYLRHS